MTRKSEILKKWQLLGPYLHRKQRTIWAAAEAEAIGPRGCALVASVTGISVRTLTKWIERLEQTENACAGSLIPPNGGIGAGRKLTEVNDPEIEPALQKMLSEEIAGDPMGRQKMGTQQFAKPEQTPWRPWPSGLHSRGRAAAPQDGIFIASCQEETSRSGPP